MKQQYNPVEHGHWMTLTRSPVKLEVGYRLACGHGAYFDAFKTLKQLPAKCDACAPESGAVGVPWCWP